MKRILSILFFSFIVSHTAEEFPFIHSFKLDNGMKVILSPNFETPLVEIEFLANHGKLNDPVGSARYGMDRASELFNLHHRTHLLNPGKHQEAFYNMGLLDYHAGFKKRQELFHTFIYQQILAEDIKKALMVSYDIFAHSEFKKDKSVFMQKFNIWRRPLRMFLERKMDFIYKQPFQLWELAQRHSISMYYGTPINYQKNYRGKGRYENLNPHQKAETWFREKYSPHNMTLMVCGNIDIDYTEKIIRDTFGNWNYKGPKDDKEELSYTAQDSSAQYRYVHYTGYNLGKQRNDGKAYSALNFVNKAPTYIDSDYYAHWLIRQMLFTRPISLLTDVFNESNHNIVDKTFSTGPKSAKEYWGFNYQTVYNPSLPHMRFYVEFDNDMIEEGYDQIYDILSNLYDNGITEGQLEIWKDQIMQDYLLAYNHPGDFSGAVIRYLNSGFDVPRMKNELNEFKALTVEDVNRVAEKYFNPDDFKIAVIGDLRHECTSLSNRFIGLEYTDDLGNIIEDRDAFKKAKDKEEEELSDFEKGMRAGSEAARNNKSMKDELDHLDDEIEKNHPKESDNESSD